MYVERNNDTKVENAPKKPEFFMRVQIWERRLASAIYMSTYDEIGRHVDFTLRVVDSSVLQVKKKESLRKKSVPRTLCGQRHSWMTITECWKERCVQKNVKSTARADGYRSCAARFLVADRRGVGWVGPEWMWGSAGSGRRLGYVENMRVCGE